MENDAQEDEKKKAAEHSASKQQQSKAKAAKEEAVLEQLSKQASGKWKPAVGELVEVPKLGSIGRVQLVKGNKVTVSVGQMPVTVKLSEVVET
jgi:DNA-directed RNA polymerase subunit E'/Rpb7